MSPISRNDSAATGIGTKTVTVSLKLSQAEYAAAESGAQLAGWSMSRWFRTTLMRMVDDPDRLTAAVVRVMSGDGKGRRGQLPKGLRTAKRAASVVLAAQEHRDLMRVAEARSVRLPSLFVQVARERMAATAALARPRPPREETAMGEVDALARRMRDLDDCHCTNETRARVTLALRDRVLSMAASVPRDRPMPDLPSTTTDSDDRLVLERVAGWLMLPSDTLWRVVCARSEARRLALRG